MKSLKGSKTEKNLLASFAGESQARNRYTYYASKAREEGYIQIANIFEETANQEREHAKRFYKFLEGGEVEITATFPAGTIGTTAENLKHAAEGENYEWKTMYPGFAKIAREEGFSACATVWEAVSVSEKRHAERYEKLLSNVEKNQVFQKPEAVFWVCSNCGYIAEAKEAPKACPACAHPQSYFELLKEPF